MKKYVVYLESHKHEYERFDSEKEAIEFVNEYYTYWLDVDEAMWYEEVEV